MLRTLLVPIDGSACATHAFEYALALAAAKGARLEICSCVDRSAIRAHWLTRPFEQEQLTASTAEAEKAVDEAVADASALRVSAQSVVCFGEPAAEIIARAEATKADAIVMGAHGRSGFKRLSIGSVAGAVLRSSACPVVVIREKARASLVTAVPKVDDIEALSVVRLLEVSPANFERLYGEIATFISGPGSALPGVVETELYGSLNAARILIITHFRTRHDWARAQWDARLGELLEEIVLASDTLEFDLYHGDRFQNVRSAGL